MPAQLRTLERGWARTLRCTAGLALAGSLMPGIGHAQAPAGDGPEDKLAEVVVTATHVQTSEITTPIFNSKHEGLHDVTAVNAVTGEALGNTDAVAFDPGTGDVLASNGEGTLTRAHADSPTQLKLIENIKTEPQARTLALDVSTHRVFLLTARFGTPPMGATPDNPHRYPVALPGTAPLLVYGP